MVSYYVTKGAKTLFFKFSVLPVINITELDGIAGFKLLFV